MSDTVLGELVPIGGGDPIPLLKPRLMIGRRSSCDIMLAFPNVSSNHCELVLKNGYWHILDLNSSNGIKVNGERCHDRFLLPEDEVLISKHAFKIMYEPSGDVPPPVEENPFSQSLMEKAGLEQRKRQPDTPPSEIPRNKSPAKPPAPKPKSSADGKNGTDDQVMDWLNE
jgi:adenylate cyclase